VSTVHLQPQKLKPLKAQVVKKIEALLAALQAPWSCVRVVSRWMIVVYLMAITNTMMNEHQDWWSKFPSRDQRVPPRVVFYDLKTTREAQKYMSTGTTNGSARFWKGARFFLCFDFRYGGRRTFDEWDRLK
jgi:hypothetical protein